MSTVPLHFVFADWFDPTAVARARLVGRVTILERNDEATLIEAVSDCDALLVRTTARVTKSVIEAAPRLRVIGRGGAGLENIDLDAARSRNVTVLSTPDASTAAVADLTVGLVIAMLRGITHGDRMIRAGRFDEGRRECVGFEVGGVTLGIIGLGRIGLAVARRFHVGFGTRIVFNDIRDPGPLPFAAERASKAGVYRQADVLTLHVPLTTDTRGMIGRDALLALRKGAFLVNTSRAGVVDSAALAEALKSNHLAGAALDVLDVEPPNADDPLLAAPNTILTPHIGSRTVGSLARMNAVVDDVIKLLQADR